MWHWSIFDDFGIVWKLRLPAFKRRQARQNPISIRSIRSHILVLMRGRKNGSSFNGMFIQRCNRIPEVNRAQQTRIRTKTWLRIDLISNGFWRAWRRLKAETGSFRTTLKSSKSAQYKVDSWPTFDFDAFLEEFWCICCIFGRKCTKIKTWPWIDNI